MGYADDSVFLPEYEPVEDKERIQGVLNSAGSTTVSPILQEWLQDFSAIYPAVTFHMEAEGSGSAAKALMSGKANLGAMSRPIKAKEVTAFKELKFYEPYELRIALDALGVIISTQNPVHRVSIQQLDALYSKERLCSDSGEAITHWKSLGWDTGGEVEIRHFDPDSGGHGFFRSKALCHGDYRPSVLPVIETSAGMVEAIKDSRFALGLASMTVIDRSVKTLKVAASEQFPAVGPNASSIAQGVYPFTRYLYLYLDKSPESELEPHIAEFVKYIYSRQGQKTALLKGSFPLSLVEISQQLNILNKLQ